MIANIYFFFRQADVRRVTDGFQRLAHAMRHILIGRMQGVILAMTVLFNVRVRRGLQRYTIRTDGLPFRCRGTKANRLGYNYGIRTEIRFARHRVIAGFGIGLAQNTPTTSFGIIVFIFACQRFVYERIESNRHSVTGFDLWDVRLNFYYVRLFTRFIRFRAWELSVFPTHFHLTGKFQSKIALHLRIFHFSLRCFAALFGDTRLVCVRLGTPTYRFFDSYI